MPRWLTRAATVALALSFCVGSAHASQIIKKYVLKYHTTFVANTTDSTAVFQIHGARKVRVVVWSTDVDTMLATSGTGLGVALADSALRNAYLTVQSATAVFGVSCEQTIASTVIRYAPSVGSYAAFFDFYPKAVGTTAQSAGQNVFTDVVAKWYSKLTGTTARATDFNVVAYVYFDLP